MYSDNENRTEEAYFGDLLKLLEENVSKQGLFFKNKDEIVSIINNMQDRLPSVIQNAYEISAKEKQILNAAREDAEDMRREAKEEAKDIIEEAREQAAELVSRDSIVLTAKEEAQKIMDSAHAYKDSLNKSTHDYVINILTNCQETVKETLDSVSQLCDDVEKNKDNFIDFIDKEE